jgi:hypothetical protein
MINQEELNISNKSYLNKDFQKLYPEILELAKQLSSKWDPSTSNESDPGVVLLKLLGFTGDKINYNIDKNILEAFMPSATQESSMRNLAEINGYFPKYYQSATSTISFMYTGNKLGPADTFTLKAFNTVITDSDNETSYTLLEDCTINSRFVTNTAPSIEGILEPLVVNNITEIHIANLDDNNRIYFPERFVAENGVFVQRTTDTGNFWTKVNNLNTTEPGQLVFKFGFDSTKNLPYIEFPTDISSIIGDGLFINYIRTKGSSGNVKTGFLTKLSTPSQILVDNNPSITIYPDSNANQSETSVLRISNLSDSTNGEDPESIDDIYNSFKRTVGTFDTLVTSRDYANAIYNSLTDDSVRVVSNVQVADRRTDINYSNQILSFNKFGPIKINLTDSADITPFELCLYPLNPIVTSFNLNTYNNSFFPLYDLAELKSGIEDYKTISHNYKTLSSDDVYLYKNYYKLNAKISTNFKVNTFEQGSILSNINDALYRDFNSRELDYGYEIPFDNLLNTIQRADSRIKNVSLEEPELYTKVMTQDRTETLLLDSVSKGPYLDLITKNILAGKISLFDYNNSFEFEFGQQAVVLTDENSPLNPGFIHENIKRVTTEVLIEEEDITSSLGYTLKENEYVQAIAPSLATELIYTVFNSYSWIGDDVIEGQEHIITGTERLILNYQDSNDSNIAVEYTPNKIITHRVAKTRESGENYYESTIVSTVSVPLNTNIFKPVGLTLKENEPYAESGILTTKIIKVNNEDEATSIQTSFYTLSTGESIEKRKFVETSLTSSPLPCYWIVNSVDNALFTSADAIYEGEGSEEVLIGYQKVLGENEFFMYSNNSLTELEVLGSGTRLTLNTTSGEDLNRWKMIFSSSNGEQNVEEKVEITTVSEKGLAAFENYNWKYFSFNSTYNLKVEEMTILTLGSGDNIKITPKIQDSSEESESEEPESFGDLTNDWVDISNEWVITYTTEGETKTLPTYSQNYLWEVRSRLDLNSGPKLNQKILTNQTITLFMDNGLGGEIKRIFNKNGNTNVNSYISFNTLLQQAGGVDINLEVTYLSGETAYDVSAYTFNYTVPTYTETDGRIVNIEKQPSGYYQINLSNIELDSSNGTQVTIPVVSYFNYQNEIGDGATQLLMIYWDQSEQSITEIELGSEVGLSGSFGPHGIRKYNDILVATLATGTNVVTLTTGNTSGLIPGQVLTKTYGIGEFGIGAKVGTISSATSFTVVNSGGTALNHATAGSITFTYAFGETLELNPGINIVEVNFVSSLKLNINKPEPAAGEESGTDVLQLSPFSVTSGYNPALNLTISDFEDSNGVLSKIKAADSEGLFFYNGTLDSVSLIEFNDISDPRALFDSNNVANKFTLPQIDFAGSRIEIVRTSKV